MKRSPVNGAELNILLYSLPDKKKWTLYWLKEFLVINFPRRPIQTKSNKFYFILCIITWRNV